MNNQNIFSEKKGPRRISTSIAMIVIGVLLIVWPQRSIDLVFRLIGVGMMVAGAVGIGYYMRNRQLVSAGYLVKVVLMLAFGLIVFFAPGTLEAVLPLLLGILFAANGVVEIAEGIMMKSAGIAGWQFTLVMAILILIAGLWMIFAPFSTARAMAIFVGITMLVSGVTSLSVKKQ